METIAPLARVLAEANGIEWRSLHGTGASGLITEADILDYLARVMSGEEDAPLTPVDPMPSPAELAAYSSPEMLSRAGVEPELAEFLKAQQGQIQEMAAPALTPAAPTLPEPVWEAPVMPELPVSAVPAMPEPARSEPIMAEPLAAQAGPELEPVRRQPEPLPTHAEPETAPLVAAEQTQGHDEFELEDEAPMPPAAPAKPAATGGLLSGLLSSLYRRNDAPRAQPTPAHPTAHQPTPVQANPVQEAPVQEAPVQEVPVPPAPVQLPFTPPAAMPAASAQPAMTQPAEMEHPTSVPDMMPEPEVAGPVYADVVPPIGSDFSFDDRPLPPAPVLGEVIEPETVPQAELPVLAEPQTAPVIPAPQAYMQPQPHSQPQVAAWSGTYLRRNTDLGVMLSAREQLTELLGELPLTLMVARAAQRHLGLLNLSTLAVADVQGQALDADLSSDLRGGIKALQSAQPGTAQADLLILDAGALDLDDLHYPHAVTLSLGRVVDGQAALSLNGNIDVQQGARFLAEVSALLGTPVKLLV